MIGEGALGLSLWTHHTLRQDCFKSRDFESVRNLGRLLLPFRVELDFLLRQTLGQLQGKELVFARGKFTRGSRVVVAEHGLLLQLGREGTPLERHRSREVLYLLRVLLMFIISFDLQIVLDHIYINRVSSWN